MKTLRAVLTTTLAMVLVASWSLQTVAATSVRSDATRATEYTAQIHKSLMAIEDGRRQAPRDRWDPQYVVDTVGLDPEALYGFMRDNIAWVPYRGALRGPVGTLMDRTANSLDMALLLADLLQRAGYQVRLARGRLDAVSLDRLWSMIEASAEGAPPQDGLSGAPRELGTVPALVPGLGPVNTTPDATERDGGIDLAQDTSGGSAFSSEESPGFGAMGGSGSMFEQVTGGGSADAPASSEEAAELYELDKAKADEMLQAAAATRAKLADELESRVVDQASRLLAQFKPGGSAQRDYEIARAVESLADHWWVQAERDGNWVDYDVLAGQTGEALSAPEETLAPDAVPMDLRHSVSLRVVTEQLANGRLKENVAFEHDFLPSEIIGQRISLRHLPLLWPADWQAITPDDVQEKLFAALYMQNEWMPALSVGREAFQQASILSTGTINPDPQPKSNPFLSIAFPAAGKVGRVVDIFDDLMDNMEAPEGQTVEKPQGDDPRAAGELTAEWLEYTIVVPGEAPRVVRRDVFDIIGPALRKSGDLSGFRMDDDKRLARAAGQMTETELIILPAWPAPEFLADLTAGLALANKPLLDEFTRDPFGKAPPNSIELFSKMSGLPGPAYLYATLRAQVGLTSGRVFVDRPQVVAQHGVLARVGPGELTAKAALDIVENAVGVDPSEDDPFFVRVLQGVADTNAEALAMPEPGLNVGQAFKLAAASPEWTIFFPADSDLLATLKLPADVTARLAADLAAGYVIVSPSGQRNPAELAGWWRVDPQTGTTLGMGNQGWGSVLVEYAFYLTIQVMLAQIACMAFTAAAEEKLSKLTAEQGREKVKAWARSCVSQALLETISGLSTSWISSRFLEGARVPTWNSRAKPGRAQPHVNAGAGGHGPGASPGTPHEGDAQRPGRTSNADGDAQPKPAHPEDRRRKSPCRADSGLVRFAALAPDLQPTQRDDGGIPLPRLATGAGCGTDDPGKPRPRNAEREERIKDATDQHLEAHKAENEARRRYEQDPTPENGRRHRDAVLKGDKARREELKRWWKEGGEGSPPGFRPGAREDYKPPSNRSPGFDDTMPGNPQPGQRQAGAKNEGPPPPNRTQPTENAPPLPPRNTAERIEAIKPQSDARRAAEQEYARAEAAYDQNKSQANYDALNNANDAYNRAHMQEIEAWNRNGGPGFPPRDALAHAATGAQPQAPQPQAPQPQAPQPQADAAPPPNRTQPMENAPPLPPRNTAERIEAIKPQSDARRAAEQEYARAEAAYDQNKSPENYDALDRANDAYNRAHMQEIEAWSRNGGQGFPPRDALAHAATGAQPQAPQPQAPQPQAPQPQADAAPPPNRTQPMENAPPLPPRNTAERIEAIKAQSDARRAAEQQYARAEAAYDQNKSPENYDALDRANDAYNRAHMQEIEAWNRNGGQGFPPRDALVVPPPASFAQGEATDLPPQPAVSRASLVGSADAISGGPSSTLSMGLGNLMGAVSKGP